MGEPFVQLRLVCGFWGEWGCVLGFDEDEVGLFPGSMEFRIGNDHGDEKIHMNIGGMNLWPLRT